VLKALLNPSRSINQSINFPDNHPLGQNTLREVPLEHSPLHSAFFIET